MSRLLSRVIWLFLLAQTLAAVNNNWNSLYSYTDGKVYLHLKNNDLVSLNFSIAGVEKGDVKLTDGQKVSKLVGPPENSTLFLVGEELYAITPKGNTDGSTDNISNSCGNISLLKYSTNKWSPLSLDSSSLTSSTYYNYPTVLTSPTNNNTIYIYGGVCGDEVTSRLLSLDMESLLLSNISTTTKPQPFYGATNLVAPNPQTQLVIGGQSNHGWLNMYQLATWDFTSGWSFKQVSEDSADSAKVNSRKFPLALPIFTPLHNSSISTISNYLEVTDVLTIGGELLNTDSTPVFAKLSLKSNDWVWNTTLNDSAINYDEMLGAATIFNALVVVNSTSINKRDSGSYTLNLYDVDTLMPIRTMKDSTTETSSNSQSTGTSTLTKAILGTIIPLGAIVMGVAAGFFILNRRKRKQNEQQFDDLSAIDYQFGNFDRESTRANPFLGEPNEKKLRPPAPVNDSSSTLEVASIDSWVKKRHEFDMERSRTIVRNSYLASNDTLSTNTETSSMEYEKTKGPEQEPLNMPERSLAGPITPQKPGPTPLSSSIVNRSVSKIKKSFSFTAPSSPLYGDYGLIKKKKSVGTLNPVISTHEDEEIWDNIFDEQLAHDITENVDADQESDLDTSIDDNRDVQVLVSSKRRSVLRVVNPDDISKSEAQSSEDNSEDDHDISRSSLTYSDISHIYNTTADEVDITQQNVNSNIRQRIPSGGKLLDE